MFKAKKTLNLQIFCMLFCVNCNLTMLFSISAFTIALKTVSGITNKKVNNTQTTILQILRVAYGITSPRLNIST